MKRYPPAEHRTILFADVEKFGDPARTNPHQLAVRDAIYKATERAFSRAKVSPDDCLVLDRGDGFLTLIRPHVPKNAVVTRLPGLLAAELVRHNARCDTPERIRLRVALHAGEVNYDDHGVTSRSIIDAYRLLEAPAFKSALASSTGVLGLIVSEWFYREVVSQNPEAEPGTYRRIWVIVDEVHTKGWIRLLDTPSLGGSHHHAAVPDRHRSAARRGR